MTDIVTRLRNWRTVHLARLHLLMEEAADEMERLSQAPCPHVVGTTTMHCSLTPFTLTEEEREAVERAADWLYRWQETHGYHSSENGDLATLRSLLERVSFIRDYPEPDNTASEDNGPAANSTPNHRTGCGESRTGTGDETVGSGASAGSHGEPVAWAVTPTGKDGEIDCEFVYPCEATAGDVALGCNGVVVPLYRSPALTDEERAAVADAADRYAAVTPESAETAATLRSLLERTK